MAVPMLNNAPVIWRKPGSIVVPFSTLKHTRNQIFFHCNLRCSSTSTATSVPSFCPQVEEAMEALYPQFQELDKLVARNTSRVLKAYRNAQVGTHHFGGSTGYGHNEAGGREALDKAFAEIVGAESALVRSQFFSGTHAIACALYGVLRPGDEL